MSKVNLSNGQDIVVLTLGSDAFMNASVPVATVGSTFTHHSVFVSPTIAEVESDGAQEVNVDQGNEIIDNLGNHYPKIVGGRPKVRVRA